MNLITLDSHGSPVSGPAVQAPQGERPYGADWKIEIAVYRPAEQIYRWRVVGHNRNTGERFAWSVPYLCWRCDLSDAHVYQELPGSPPTRH